MDVRRSPGSDKRSALNSLLNAAPSTEMAEDLIDVFRQLHRIGDSAATTATIRAKSAAPWIIAVTGWCLGIPPSIYMETDVQLVKQPRSRVDIIIGLKVSSEEAFFEITVRHDHGHPYKFVIPTTNESWRGMVSIEAYGTWLLQTWDNNEEHTMEGYEALCEAIDYSILPAVSLINNSPVSEPDTISEPGSDQSSGSIRYYCVEPLANMHHIWLAYSRLLHTGTNGRSRFKSLPQGMTINKLPLVSKYLKTRKRFCTCPECNPSRSSRRLGN
jgi:hypothetical protein